MESEKTVAAMLAALDTQVWEQVALRKLQHFPRLKLKEESNQMLTDFTMIMAKCRTGSSQLLSLEHETAAPAKDSMNVGQVKTRKRREELSRVIEVVPTIMRTQPKRGTTAEKVISTASIKLTEVENDENQQITDGLREKIKEYKTISLKEGAEQAKKAEESRLRAEQRLKKYKEARQFAFDYDGNILNANINPKQGINILSMRSQYETQVERQKSRQRNIVKKITLEVNEASNANQDNKGENIGRILSMFDEEKSIANGVKITDMGTNKSIGFHETQREGFQQLKLRQFKEFSKERWGFSRSKTVYNPQMTQLTQNSQQFVERHKICLQESARVTGSQRKIGSHWTTERTSVDNSRVKMSRGSISVKNTTLYTLNFGTIEK